MVEQWFVVLGTAMEIRLMLLQCSSTFLTKFVELILIVKWF